MGSRLMFGPRKADRSVLQKLKELNWAMVLTLAVIAGIGIAMQYSVAFGSFDPYALRQLIRFTAMLLLLLVIALVDIRVWMTLAYPTYLAGLVLLVAVELFGFSGKGGQRWLDLGVMTLQPSELMKIGVIMALARYFHGLTAHQARQIKSLILPVLMLAIPAVLIIRQPDLGTALMLLLGGIAVIFLAGARLWLFVTGAVVGVAAIPVIWNLLRPYQKERVLTFLNPERDPLGAGYQILQSKIALGSGGLFGKGFMEGTQSHLNFVPEMKTDFIFTVLAEEFGVVGGVGLLCLYLVLLGYAALIAVSSRSQFGRLLALGLAFALFLYVFINMAMVMGLVPVVGVPLPLVSYGGSAMLTMMVAYGLILSVALNRRLSIPRKHPFG